MATLNMKPAERMVLSDLIDTWYKNPRHPMIISTLLYEAARDLEVEPHRTDEEIENLTDAMVSEDIIDLLNDLGYKLSGPIDDRDTVITKTSELSINGRTFNK